MESQVCSKKEEKKSDHKALIKITFKSSPLLKFHTDSSDSMDDFPLPSLFPKSLFPKSLFPKESGMSLNVPKRHGFTMRFSTSSKGKRPSKAENQ